MTCSTTNRAKGFLLTAGLLLTAAGLIGALSGALSQPAAQSASSTAASVVGTACSETGVTLLVEFGPESGLPGQISCHENYIGNGWDLLHLAGHKPEGTRQYPNAFVCRIAGWPTTENQDCLDTPSYQEGTWVYFKSLVGTWVRSGQGAADPANKVACGSAEAWLFVNPATPESAQVPSVSVPDVTCNKE